MNGSCARPRVSTKNPPSGSPLAAAPERPAGAGLAGLRLKRKRHTLQRNDKQNRSVAPNNPLPLGFIAGEEGKKKPNQNPGTELLLLGPSLLRSLAEPGAPSLPRAGIGVAQVTRLQLHSLPGNPILHFNYREAVSPAYLYHLKCLGSTIPVLPPGYF